MRFDFVIGCYDSRPFNVCWDCWYAW